MDTSHPGLDAPADATPEDRRASEWGPDAFVDPAEADHDALNAQAEARAQARARVDKLEMQLAMRDLSEGTRGLIRVAPFTAVVVAAAVGMMLGRRRAKPFRAAPPRRR